MAAPPIDRTAARALAHELVSGGGPLLAEEPPRLRVIIDEFVLRREIGGPDVLRGQLAHLLVTAELPHVDLRVLPASIGTHAGHSGYFLVFTIAEPNMDVGFAETVGGARSSRRSPSSSSAPSERICHDPRGPGPRLGGPGRSRLGDQADTAPITAGVASRRCPT